jgi:ribulose-5-phosphate 4-epimerase/fuculose-1-phosphate aldolase
MTAPTDPDWTSLVGSLTELGRGLVSAGLVLASGGNLSARDQGAYVGPVRVAPYRHPGTPELATEAAALLADGECDCVVLSHHGCSVLGDSVETAHRRVLNLEEAARLTYAALLLGDTATVCPPAFRDRLRGRGGH